MTTITLDTLADSRVRPQAEARMDTPATAQRLVVSLVLAGTIEGRSDVDALEFVVAQQHRAVLAAGLREAADLLEAHRV